MKSPRSRKAFSGILHPALQQAGTASHTPSSSAQSRYDPVKVPTTAPPNLIQSRTLISQRTPSYTLGSSGANEISPSSGKRAFSASYIGAQPLDTSEMDLTPSRKRIGRQTRKLEANSMANTSHQAVQHTAVPTPNEVKSRYTTYASARRAARKAKQDQNAGKDTPKPAGTEEPEDFSKYYNYLAEIGGYSLDEDPREQNTPTCPALTRPAPSRSYVSPYNPVNASGNSNQHQTNMKTSGPASNPPPTELTGDSTVTRPVSSQVDPYASPPFKIIGLKNQELYGWSDEEVLDHSQRLHLIKTQQNRTLRQFREDKGLSNDVKLTYSYVQGVMIPRVATTPRTSNTQAPTDQFVQGNVPSNTLQNTSVSQNPLVGHPSLEPSRRMAEEHAQKSRILQAQSLSADTRGYAAASNELSSTKSIQQQQDGGLWSQSIQQPTFLDRPVNQSTLQLCNPLLQQIQQNLYPNTPIEMSPTQLNISSSFQTHQGASYDGHVETNAVQSYFPPCLDTVALSRNELSSPSLPTQYSRDYQDVNMDLKDSLNSQKIPVYQEPGTKRSKPRPKVRAEDREQYELFKSHLRNGTFFQPNLPAYLVLRAREKFKILPGLDSDSSDSDFEPPPKPPPYQRIQATAETGPLPNINQPYTGSQDMDRIWYAMYYYQDYPIEQLPKPSNYPKKLPKPVETPKSEKKAPKPKKTPTPRKSRAKKGTQSSERAMIPRTVTPRSSTSMPPVYDFAISAGSQINEQTLANMKAGNYAEFFESAEAEAKWKQDAVNQFMAEKDTPSKYALKKAERERKRLENELGAEQ